MPGRDPLDDAESLEDLNDEEDEDTWIEGGKYFNVVDEDEEDIDLDDDDFDDEED